jgi:hypothetical protein
MSETAPAPRAAVVYESMFGNTSHVAHAVADGLRAAGCDTETAEVNTAPEPHPDVALLVVGAPTHAFSLSRPRTRQDAVSQGAPPTRAGRGLREWLQETEPPGPATGVAVFDTRVPKARRLPAAGRAAARLARSSGFRLVGKPVPFLVEGTAGPLCEGEEERAFRWGQTLGEALLDLAPARQGTKGPPMS